MTEARMKVSEYIEWNGLRGALTGQGPTMMFARYDEILKEMTKSLYRQTLCLISSNLPRTRVSPPVLLEDIWR